MRPQHRQPLLPCRAAQGGGKGIHDRLPVGEGAVAGRTLGDPGRMLPPRRRS